MDQLTRSTIGQGFVRAFGVVVYSSAVAFLLTNGEKIFGNSPKVLGVATFLMLLVFSVAVAGLLLFTSPVLLYVEGKKSESIMLLIATIIWLTVLTTLVLALQLMV